MGVVAAELGKLGIRPASSLTAPTEGLAADRAIPVVEALRGVLPYKGLVRGSTVAVAGVGATSVMFALLAEATARGSWAALVGMPGLGLAAAHAMGVSLQRLAVVPQPGPDLLAVAAVLLDGFDLVVLGGQGVVSASSAAQLSARACKAGSVLVSMLEWPAPNMSITCQGGRWLSRGRLRCRELTVRVAGRGIAGRPVDEQVWLPDDAAFRAAVAEREAGRQDKPAIRRLRAVS